MKDSLDVVLCSLLRVGLGLSQGFPYAPTEEEWQILFKMAKQQTVLGIVSNALPCLPEQARPPRQLIMRLSFMAETIRGDEFPDEPGGCTLYATFCGTRFPERHIEGAGQRAAVSRSAFAAGGRY